MKNTIKLKFTLVAFTLFISFITIAQEKHIITLYVDTDKVDMRNLSSTCNFGQDPNISNEDYTIDIGKGDTVIWVGKSKSNENDIVLIKKINYGSGTNFFGTNTLKGRDGEVTGEIVSGEPGDYEKYEIEFKVVRDGHQLRETFPIDPKLRMKR